jgi:hypothetical protein
MAVIGVLPNAQCPMPNSGGAHQLTTPSYGCLFDLSSYFSEVFCTFKQFEWVAYGFFCLVLGMFLAPRTSSAQVETTIEGVRLDLSSEQLDLSVKLGAFRANETIVKKLTFINTSLHSLTPSGVKTSCGCVVAKLPATTILPSGSASFDVSLRSGAGIFEKTIDMSFRELSRPVVVRLSGEAKNRFTVNPGVVYLSPKKASREVVLTSEFGDTFSNVQCRSLGDLVKVVVKESKEDNLRLLVSCANSEDRFWHGVNSAFETIELSFSNDIKLQVDLRVDSLVGVSIFPRVVSFGDSNRTEQVSVFRREDTVPPQFMRFVLNGKVIASGTLSSNSRKSSLARYAIKPTVDIAIKTGTYEAAVEESDDEIVWRELAFVYFTFE